MAGVTRLFGQAAAHDDAMNASLEVILGLVAPALTLVQQATVVVGKGVRHLVVDGVVTDLARGVGHAQRHAQHVLDEQHDQRRPHDVPADDEQRSHDLQPHLLSVAVDGAAWVRQAERCAAGCRREETGADTTDQCTDKVGVEHVKGVIDVLEDRKIAFAQIECDLFGALVGIELNHCIGTNLPKGSCQIQDPGRWHPNQRPHRRQV